MQNTLLSQDIIEKQKKQVFDTEPTIKLVSACKIGNGIINIPLQRRQELIQFFEDSNKNAHFFIPASGSGSRMFQFLYDFIVSPNDENRGLMERFLNHIHEFSFYSLFSEELKQKISSYDLDLEWFVNQLLSGEAFRFGEIPKGLVPFHKIGPFVLNPFQEQILQGIRVSAEKSSFHFTVKHDFLSTIEDSIQSALKLSGHQVDVQFSVQDPNSDAIAFDPTSQEPYLIESGDVLTRPAGHGALLQNLNQIDSDIIFIRNIDNVQHFSKSHESVDTWKFLGGIAFSFQEDLKSLKTNPTMEGFEALNKSYQILPDEELLNLGIEKLVRIFDLPIRVCGMVRNEGQPGGGPFWIESDGEISKQIVEKAHVDTRGNQYRILAQSTHFNPVMIAAITRDLDGNKLDLNKFSDERKFFIVDKKFKGNDIRFRELPGLWNGSMAYWNTIFVEIPSHTFTPVKTVLDLLDSAHHE
jgi:hypothetical protein